jgi:hypothetical protein
MSAPDELDVDVDAVVAATLQCPAVAGMHSGGMRFVVTYLAGRRVVGVRADDDRVLVSVVLAQGASVPRLEGQVREAVAPIVRGRYVDVLVADVDTGEKPGADAPGPQVSTA